MSEFWKSTPKYWCKYCSAYVKDTPLEKTNHEASPRHQGNLRKSLRDLHRSNEKAERDQQYAKAEAARLNGTGSTAAPLPGSGDGKFKTTVNFTRHGSKPATVDDRKRQMAQLAAMGVAVPEDFRKENAMVGGWQATTHKVIWEDKPEETQDEETDVKPGLNVGVRKRKADEKEEEGEEEHVKLEEGRRRPRFGRDLRAMPGDNDDDVLDALLGATTNFIKKQKAEFENEVKIEQNTAHVKESAGEQQKDQDQSAQDGESNVTVKQEELTEDLVVPPGKSDPEPSEDNDVGSIFKKRRKPTKVK